MKTLKHYSSFLSTHGKHDAQEKPQLQPKRSFASFLSPTQPQDGAYEKTTPKPKRSFGFLAHTPQHDTHEKQLKPKRSFATLFNPNRSPTTTADTAASTPDLSPSTSSSAFDSDFQPEFTPPASTSEYRWHYSPAPRMWWRNVESMANFVLHWAERFHQHGDMFVACTLTSSTSSTSPLSLTRAQLMEAVRRLRYDRPTIALRLAKRSSVGVEPLTNIPELIASKVDLQVALVYDLVESEQEVEAWLDDVVHYHAEDEQDGGFEAFVERSTVDGTPLRDRLRVHYFPLTSTLVAEQSHSVSEGVGTLLTFNLLLTSIASVLASPTPASFAWGDEVTRLEPALQDAIASPPPTWTVSKQERKQVAQVNADRMNGKATAPNLADRLGSKAVSLALAGQDHHRTLTKPLVKLCRSVAERGEMLPLGLLPQTGRPFTGVRTHTGMLSDTLTPTQTSALLAALKRRGLTLAPFMEAALHMATVWVRNQRGLTGKGDAGRILGSFSNAVSKRDTLLPQYREYLGMCMSGFPTKIAASRVTWCSTTPTSASPTDPNDLLPTPTHTDLDQLFNITSDLAAQYRTGRSNPNWLRNDQALLFSSMQTEYLFLSNPAHYPSMPWLSSIGKIDSLVSPTHPTLAAHNLRVVGRMCIRQPVFHVYSFRGTTTLQLSFADWYYNGVDSEATKCHRTGEQRQSILVLWMQTVRSLIDAVLQAEV